MALAPSDAELRHRHAQLLADLGRTVEAALALDPNHPWSHLKPSEMLLHLGRTADALAHAQRAASLAPGSAKLRAHLAKLSNLTADAAAGRATPAAARA
jgi:hypothetical protein